MEPVQQTIKAIQDLWASGGAAKYYLLFIPAFAVAGMVFSIMQNNARLRKVKEFKAGHPEAAGIVLKAGGTFITPHRMYINQVEGQEFVWEVVAGGRYKYWLTPGEVVIHASYEKTRPGFFYRSVTKSFGPVKLSLNLEANKSYVLRLVDDEFEIREE